MPSWWRDVDRSIRLGIAEYEFVIARLEMLLAGTSNKSSKSVMLNTRGLENLLREAKSAEKRVARSLSLAAARRRDARAVGLIPPGSRDLAARARAALAKSHVVGESVRGRMARIRSELRHLGRPKNRMSMSAPPLQIDVHI